ncbi:MAG: endonuclease MutS2 [candidate division Zixibacteria bacterium]|nr:endonuclease MutS2 [candidate division Zixibacteria bacterium]
MIDQHTLDILEYPKVIAQVAGRCLTPYGADEVNRIRPLYDPAEIERRGSEISQMRDIVSFGMAFPLARMENCRPELLRAQVEGVFLDPEQILRVLELVEVSIALNGYDREGRPKFPLIAAYLEQVRAFPELKAEIRRAIDENGEVKDSASPKLKQVRAEFGDAKRRLVARLTAIQADRPHEAGVQDDIVTMRNGRYVITVPSSSYRANMGILHDRSQTGATLYIEPPETVELNNRLNLLQQEERLEIDRILRAITAEIARRGEALLENTRLIGRLDSLYACAKYSKAVGGNKPALGPESSLSLVDARHPLLAVQFGKPEAVVANSLALDDLRQAILVTGPNTGGKTICLKTVGLAVLMAQSGLHIAAADKSSVGIFEYVCADIGDEQSIELSLSTFSSHVRNLIDGVRKASPRTLLLFDEIGAGTDPKEGAALAEAIILHAIRKGARMIVTTHFSQLKTLPMDNPEIENASFEFDRTTLAPTYRLQLGTPGSSYAIEIASRLGMSEEITERASRLVGSGEKSLAALISSLESELAVVRKDRAELTDRLAEARRLEDTYRSRVDELTTNVEETRRRALAETEAFIEQTRREVEQLVADIRRSQAEPQQVKNFHRSLRERAKELSSLKKASETPAPEPGRFEKGDRVEIVSLGQAGEIDELLGDDRARVKVRNVFTTVEIRHLRRLEEGGAPARPEATGARVSARPVESPEIHLRGLTGDEAIEELERYLDRAVVAGLHQVYVVHGKGTGALRKRITEYLREHPEVASVRLGNWNEGGAGVTIVKLKE